MDEIIRKFKISGGEKIKLDDYKPNESCNYKKEEGDDILNNFKAEMDELQEKLYVTNRYSLLIIFQAMDAAGKDSAIKHVMSGINPQGCQVFSFKQPNSEELEHDFLWRHAKALPEKGRIGIHNRSHYENVLVCKVHPELILKEGVTNKNSIRDLDNEFWDNRYQSICNFEKHLNSNGTIIIKFFLHLSKDEQKKRFLERIDNPSKNWKFSSSDVAERGRWDDYMKAYEDVISATATQHAPWYIIPADKKWFSRIVIGKVIVDTLRAIDLKLPELSEEERAKLADSRQQIISE